MGRRIVLASGALQTLQKGARRHVAAQSFSAVFAAVRDATTIRPRGMGRRTSRGRFPSMSAVVTRPFAVEETTIADLHAAYLDGRTNVRAVVQGFLNRIAAYDRKGPALGLVISMNAG